jgi:hypothetical protein
MANIRTVYRTAQGKEIDLNKLINRNELTLAVGNMIVNARGDKIGAGGQIVKDTTNGVTIPDQISKSVDQPVPSLEEQKVEESAKPSRKGQSSEETTQQ